MRQAGMTAMEYFDVCYKYIDGTHSDVSEEVKMQIASRMALTASIDYATAAFTGSIHGYPGIKVLVNGSGLEEWLKDLPTKPK